MVPDRGLEELRAQPDTAPPSPFHSFCPFCVGNESKTPPESLAFRPEGAKANSSPWRVRVVANKFPVLDSHLPPSPATLGIYDSLGGFGVHEVVIETPNHTADFSTLPQEHAAEVVMAWRSRIRTIGEDPRIKSVLLFRNRGAEAGASLAHPHSQIIGLPIVPKLLMEEITYAHRYYEWKERCVFCDILHDELRQGVRIIKDSPHFVAFAPYASRFAYEMCIVPKRHRAHFREASDGELKELASVLRDVIGRLNGVLDNPPYNLLMHSAPCPEGDTPHYHWHIEIMPRLTRVAGFEWGTGFYVNPVMPEDAVRALERAG